MGAPFAGSHDVRILPALILVGAACLAMGCGASDAADPACFAETSPTPSAPVADAFVAAQTDAESREWDATRPLVIDLEECAHARWFTWLSFGSAWVVASPTADGTACELWLGGETENPLYDGSPSQFCRFRRDSCEATVELAVDEGGPAYLDSAGCTSL